MRSFFCLVEVKFCSSDNDIMTVSYKIIDQIFSIECPWSSFYQSNIIYTERFITLNFLK